MFEYIIIVCFLYGIRWFNLGRKSVDDLTEKQREYIHKLHYKKKSSKDIEEFHKSLKPQGLTFIVLGVVFLVAYIALIISIFTGALQ